MMFRRNRSKALDNSRVEELDDSSNNERKQIDDIGTCPEESSSCNPPDCETEKVDLKEARKNKWYHNLLLRRDRLHPRKVEDRSRNLEEEARINNETEQDSFNSTAPLSSRDGIVRAEDGVEVNRTTSKLCKKNDRNFKTMEALGIYGLLTPAIAALPATDEFDAVHKQIKIDLGEDWELKLAAAHVDDALKGRGKYGKARSYYKSKFSQRCFNILDNIWYRRFFLLIIIVHSLIIFFEPPSYTLKSIHFMVYTAVGICLLIYVFDLVLRVQFLSWKVFWSNGTEEGYWNGLQFLLVCAFWIDFIILCTSVLINMYLPQPFRCLRLVMLLCRVRSIRHIFQVLAIIGNSLLKVLFIILIFIITFACVGVHLFMGIYNTSFQTATNTSQSEQCCVDVDSEEKIYKGAFDNVGIAILRLFVLLSTENYPEIMLPALRNSSMYFFYFGTFVFFGGFFLTAILLAIVVDSYWIFAKKTIKKEIAIERAELAKAWNLLDPIGLGALPVDDKQFKDLFKLLKPKNTDDQNLVLIHLLDSQGDGEIDSFEWTTTLREALNAEFEEENNFASQETENNIINKLRKKARSIVESQVVSKLVLCLLLLHGLLFCLRWKNQSTEWKNVVHGLRAAVTALLGVDALIRVFGFGKHMFNLLEILDIVMMCLALLFNCLYYINTTEQHFKDICVIISSLAVIIRWMLNSAGPRKAFRWFLNIFPVMFDLVVLLFIILYLLATIAMEIFYKYDAPSQERIYPANCGLGFKNFRCSFLNMFQTLTTSNWHEIMNLAHSQSKSTVAYFFFPLSYIIITMIVMNLFVAIAIEAANKLTSKRADSTVSLTHQATFDSIHQKPRHTFHESAKKLLSVMAKNIIGSARAEETEVRGSLQAINVPTSPSTRTLKGSRKGSTTIILSRQCKRKDDNQNSHRKGNNTVDAEKQAEESEDADDGENNEDYSGLSPKTKREKQLKNRMKKKRKARQKAKQTQSRVIDQIQKQVRAISSFRGSQPTDLDFVVGDTITVIATRDEWMQGECKGATGWFPASHVVNWTAKVHRDSKARALQNKTDFAAVVTEVNSVTDENQTSQSTNVTSNVDLPTAKKSTSSLLPQPNYRIKLKSGDWRREILGKMTVMNAEEMRELNKVMRAEIRAPGTRGSKSNLGYEKPPISPTPVKRDAIPIVEEFSATDFVDYQLREGTVERMKRARSNTNISNDAFATESPVVNIRQAKAESVSKVSMVVPPKETLGRRKSTDAAEIQSLGDDLSVRRCPTLSISQLANIEFPAAAEPQSTEAQHEDAIVALATDEKSRLGSDLQSEKTPENIPKEEKGAKNKSGEMPDWAKKFAETKNIDVQNVSFPEPTACESLPGSVDDASVVNLRC